MQSIPNQASNAEEQINQGDAGPDIDVALDEQGNEIKRLDPEMFKDKPMPGFEK